MGRGAVAPLHRLMKVRERMWTFGYWDTKKLVQKKELYLMELVLDNN